ncbi:MAG: hypothetical protein OEV20_07170 [Actinomycetota bacterium]|nr:hypothetical protein [Actinomycetota bacterium]
MAEATLSAASARTRSWPVWSIVSALVVAGTLIPIALMLATGRSPSVHFWATSFFFAVNALIAFWELALFRHADDIRAEYEASRERARGRELAHIFEFFRRPVPSGQIFTLRPWAGVWAAYAVMDPAYADKKSFGFAIDIGNGYSTLLPSLLVPIAIVFEWVPAQWLGILIVVFSWQMFYGTLLYFTSFVINRRYEGHRLRDLFVFVGLSNLVWTTFPVWTGALGIWMILHDGFAPFSS